MQVYQERGAISWLFCNRARKAKKRRQKESQDHHPLRYYCIRYYVRNYLKKGSWESPIMQKLYFRKHIRWSLFGQMLCDPARQDFYGECYFGLFLEPSVKKGNIGDIFGLSRWRGGKCPSGKMLWSSCFHHMLTFFWLWTIMDVFGYVDIFIFVIRRQWVISNLDSLPW